MAYQQAISFNISKGGNTPNFCLANVCKGYSIANKYDSAWQAWENTQQLAGDPPASLDVPVYFSYTATIDGTNANWGHIGVRLSDGRFWSDGNIYPSIAAYQANHTPRYVGWGESINDATIIKPVEEEFMGKWDNGKTYNLLFHACNIGIAERAKKANYVGYFGAADGKDAAEAFDGIISSPQFDFLIDEARKAAQPSGFVPVTEQLFKKG